jgi:hypothetical protein
MKPIMMTPQVYKQLIISGIQDLSPALLAEVANFVYFVRKQAEAPDAFASEQYALLLNQDRKTLNQDELHHLETEIAGYEQQYPHE